MVYLAVLRLFLGIQNQTTASFFSQNCVNNFLGYEFTKGFPNFSLYALKRGVIPQQVVTLDEPFKSYKFSLKYVRIQRV